MNYFYTGKDYKFREYTECDPFPVDTLLDISITTEAYYSSLKESQISYIVVDTANHYKKDSKLILPVGETHIEFADVEIDNDSLERFYYMGQIPFLNSYLMLLVGWEYFDYFLIDKTTGERSEFVFDDYPFVSPNKKYVVCIYANPYSTSAEMQVFKIAVNKLDYLYKFDFVNWMPTTQTTSLLWISDNSFVVKAIHPKSFWDKEGNQNENGEYIKIEILK